MPSASVRTFADPDDYAANIPANVELTIVGRGQFAAKLTRVDLHRLHLLRSDDNLPRVRHAVNNGGWAVIGFRVDSGPSLLRAGREELPTNIIRSAEGDDYYHRSAGPACQAGMWLSVEEMVSAGETIAGCDLSPPRDAMLIVPPPPQMSKLRRLHAAAGHLAEEAPEVIANSTAARGLEQALIEAVVDCLVHSEDSQKSVALGQHEIVMQRFRQVLEQHSERPLFIPEICQAIRVSERTLRICSQEYLGMSPKRYLLLRRMHMVHRMLRDSAPTATTVTDVAMQHGFWQLGRFAVAYRALFGEPPSATLHRKFY